MKDFIKAIVIDVAMLWCIAVAYLNINGMGQLAENAISFFGILSLVVGTIVLFSYKGSAAKKLEEGRYKQKSKAYYVLRNFTAAAKIALVAAFGWYWVACGFLVLYLAAKAELAEINKLLADKTE